MSSGTQRRKDLIAQVEACVCKDRQNTYGDAESNFAVIADYWNLWLKSRGLTAVVDATDVAMMSALIKVARAASSPGHIDNWVDLAGYSICGGGIEVKKAARGKIVLEPKESFRQAVEKAHEGFWEGFDVWAKQLEAEKARRLMATTATPKAPSDNAPNQSVS